MTIESNSREYSRIRALNKKKSLRKKRGIKCENKIQPLTLSTNQDQPDIFFKHDKMKAVFHEWYFVCTHFDIYYVLNLWITCCVICQSQKGFFFFFFFFLLQKTRSTFLQTTP